MAQALINHKIIPWAYNRAGIAPDLLASRMKIKADKFREWETGESRPTFKQARKLAKLLHIPFGYLFLTEEPDDSVPVSDFRTIGSRAAREPSADLKDLLNDLMLKQSWYREYILEHIGDPVSVIGNFTAGSPAQAIADDIKYKLKLTIEDRKQARNAKAFYNLLVERIEHFNILVMKSGIVGSNTHRPLDVNEFRGITIYDEYAPLIFINGRDAEAAQIFTLIHELAHLWIGGGGISNPSLTTRKDMLSTSTERLCNSVAAEVLVPHEELQRKWDAGKSLEEITAAFGKLFRVSQVVVARRAYDINLITWEEYYFFYKTQEKMWNRPKRGGGNSYNTIPVRNSRTFTNAVIQHARSNRILLRDAGILLGVSPAKINNLAAHLSIR